MTTKALQIRDAIVTLLRASTCGGVPSDRVYVDLDDDIEGETEELPAIDVSLGDEDSQRGVIGLRQRMVQVSVTVFSAATKGVGAADAVTNADPALAELHRRIVAEVTLGGLSFDLQDTGPKRERYKLDKSMLKTRITYDVQYDTTETSLEA